jgi:hypothetical protein
LLLPSYSPLRDTRIMFGEKCKSWSFSVCSVLTLLLPFLSIQCPDSPVTISQYAFSSLSCYRFSVCSFLNLLLQFLSMQFPHSPVTSSQYAVSSFSCYYFSVCSFLTLLLPFLSIQFPHSPVTVSPLGTIVPQKQIVLFFKCKHPVLFSNN